MLPKKNRADTKTIEKIFTKGRFIVSPSLTFKFISNNNDESPRISFIAPKSVAKLAVKRNLLRRVGYNALKKYISLFPAGVTGAFVFKTYQDNISTIENEIKDILHKIN